MNNITKGYLKNLALLSTFVISQIHTLFSTYKDWRVDWYLLIEHSKRVDFAVFYSGIAINFLIMAYCLHYPKGISRGISRFILIITVLDMFHLLLMARQGFGMAKIGIALLIYIAYVFYNKTNGDNKNNI